VRKLACALDVSRLTALAVAVEIGNWSRFASNSIDSFDGLVPSECSSGASRV
jgi:transposase